MRGQKLGEIFPNQVHKPDLLLADHVFYLVGHIDISIDTVQNLNISTIFYFTISIISRPSLETGENRDESDSSIEDLWTDERASRGTSDHTLMEWWT